MRDLSDVLPAQMFAGTAFSARKAEARANGRWDNGCMGCECFIIRARQRVANQWVVRPESSIFYVQQLLRPIEDGCARVRDKCSFRAIYCLVRQTYRAPNQGDWILTEHEWK